VFFTLVVGLMLFFVVRYRRRNGVAPGETPSHNTALEITWTLIPLAIVTLIFYQGFAAYMDMQTAPPGCYEVRVSARQWAWQFVYPNGHVDENLHVAAGRPVKLTMTSADVLHGLWIPDFRVKMDLVPGRYTTTWFQALRPGTYQLLCTEYCGGNQQRGHSDMLASVVVHTPDEFQAWLKDAADFLKNLPPAEAGKILYQRRGCAQCHSIDGSRGTLAGPTLKGIFGTTHDLADGSSVTVDDNYIRESILEPQAKIRAGYKPVMSTYQGTLSDGDITALIEFIKSTSEKPADGPNE
jgi:cytochrome c oxidase subunit 2